MKAFLSAIVVAVVIASGASYYLTNFVDQACDRRFRYIRRAALDLTFEVFERHCERSEAIY